MITLIQGDCLEEMKKIPDGSVDLVVTDPPYNTGMTRKDNASSTWLNSFFDDRYSDEDYSNLADSVCVELYRTLKNNSACYIYINWKSIGVWVNSLKKAGFLLKNCIVWDKVVHGLNYQNYAYTHEFILCAVKGKFRPNNKDGGVLWKDVWHIRRVMGKKRDQLKHETIKAMEVVEPPILHGSIGGGAYLTPLWGAEPLVLLAKT